MADSDVIPSLVVHKELLTVPDVSFCGAVGTVMNRVSRSWRDVNCPDCLRQGVVSLVMNGALDEEGLQGMSSK